MKRIKYEIIFLIRLTPIVRICFILLAAFFPVSGHSLTDSKTIILENCDTCHGTDGIATVESWPHLACQNRGYIYFRLIKFKTDSDHDIDKLVKSLTLSHIEEISQYYSTTVCPRTIF